MRDEEIDRLRAKVGKITMDNELLYEKIARLEAGHPFGRRTSKGWPASRFTVLGRTAANGWTLWFQGAGQDCSAPTDPGGVVGMSAQMYCAPSLIEAQGKGSFTAHVRGTTPQAVPLRLA